LGTSLMMTLARRWFTNQERLHRCKNDLGRLKALKKIAKKAKDKLAVENNAGTVGLVKMIQMGAEGRALLFSIVPVALLATWAWQRMAYIPAPADKPLAIRAYFAPSALDRLAWLCPAPGLQLADGNYVQRVRSIASDPAKPDSKDPMAVWNIKASPSVHDLDLCIQIGDQVVHHPCQIGLSTYATPIVEHTDGPIITTEAVLVDPKFLGILPGFSQYGFGSWLIAYVILASIFVPLLRKVLKVY